MIIDNSAEMKMIIVMNVVLFVICYFPFIMGVHWLENEEEFL